MFECSSSAVPVRTFHTSSRRAASGPLRAARGTPRLAALLPARRPRLRATTGGHDEARHRRGSAIAGLPVSASRTTAASRPAAPASQTTTAPHGSGPIGRGRQRTVPAGRGRAGPWPQGRCLRRAGPPALRPGDGLRRPGLLAPDPRRLWDAPAATAYPSHTGGHQTAPVHLGTARTHPHPMIVRYTRGTDAAWKQWITMEVDIRRTTCSAP